MFGEFKFARNRAAVLRRRQFLPLPRQRLALLSARCLVPGCAGFPLVGDDGQGIGYASNT